MAKPGFKLTLFTTCFALLVVVVGAYTRLVDAGLGCPDWPGCYGHFDVPNTAAEIAKAELLFPDSPVEAEKAWPEMIHRYIASLLGLLIIIIAVISWRHRHEPDQPVKLPIFLVGLVILQGIFGAWTVTLKLWPQVVTAHLLGGFTTLSLLGLLSLRLSPWGKKMQKPSLDQYSIKQLKPLMSVALAVLVVQIMLGGWTSSNYAALACPDLPGCQGQLWPPMDFSEGFNLAQSIGPNYLGGQLDSSARTAIHMMHRIGAIIATIVLLSLFFRLYRLGKNSYLRNLSYTLLAALVIQVSLGLSNIIWYLPLSVAVGHNAGAALLVLVLVAVFYCVHQENKLSLESTH